jgi:hypothetical protein
MGDSMTTPQYFGKTAATNAPQQTGNGVLTIASLRFFSRGRVRYVSSSFSFS